MIQRALSSKKKVSGFFDLGFGFVGLASLKENGSGLFEECMGILRFIDGSFEKGNEGLR